MRSEIAGAALPVAMLAAALAIGVCARDAEAATVTGAYGGAVTEINVSRGETFTAFAVGDTYTFNYSFDTDAADDSPLPRAGVYLGAFNATVTFSNGFSFAIDGGTLAVDNSAVDELVFAGKAGIVGAPAVGSWALTTPTLFFTDTTGTVFHDDHLPTSHLLASLFDFNQASFLFARGDKQANVATSVTDLVPTPIPPTFLLFSSALGGLGFLGWKRRKNAIPLFGSSAQPAR